MIAEGLRDIGEVDVISLGKQKNPSLAGYDTVILGTSVHMGKPGKAMHRYTTETEHKNVLQTKRTALFLCCMEDDAEKCARQFEHAFPEYLRRSASATAVVGGEFLMGEMNGLERMIARKITGSRDSVSKLQRKHIEDFIAEIKLSV